MNRPECKPELYASDVLLKAINGAHSLVSLSDQYNQNGMYFRGYLVGLQYALAVLGAVFNESEVSTKSFRCPGRRSHL